MRKRYFLASLLSCVVLLARGPARIGAQEAALRTQGATDAGVNAPAAGEIEQHDQAALTRKLKQLLAEARDEAVRAPAKQAEDALARARSSQDTEAKARQLALARAALALAEARVALLRERELVSSSSRRRVEAARRAEQARMLLKQAQQPCASCSQPSAEPTSGQR